MSNELEALADDGGLDDLATALASGLAAVYRQRHPLPPAPGPEPDPGLPPGFRVVTPAEAQWLARYCPNCRRARQECECIFP